MQEGLQDLLGGAAAIGEEQLVHVEARAREPPPIIQLQHNANFVMRLRQGTVPIDWAFIHLVMPTTTSNRGCLYLQPVSTCTLPLHWNDVNIDSERVE